MSGESSLLFYFVIQSVCMLNTQYINSMLCLLFVFFLFQEASFVFYFSHAGLHSDERQEMKKQLLLFFCLAVSFFSAFYMSKAIWLRECMFVGMMENEEG